MTQNYQYGCMVQKQKPVLWATEYLMEYLKWEGCYQIRMLGRSWSWPHGGNIGWGDTECREPDKATLPKK